MLNITGLGPAGLINRKISKPVSSANGFHLPDAEAASSTHEAQETAPATPMAQAEAPRADLPEVRDRAARKHGEETLQALADLQRDMLANADHPEHLERLVQLSANPPEAATPGLRSALRQIAVRAHVELARQEVARANRQTAQNA